MFAISPSLSSMDSLKDPGHLERDWLPTLKTLGDTLINCSHAFQALALKKLDGFSLSCKVYIEQSARTAVWIRAALENRIHLPSQSDGRLFRALEHALDVVLYHFQHVLQLCERVLKTLRRNPTYRILRARRNLFLRDQHGLFIRLLDLRSDIDKLMELVPMPPGYTEIDSQSPRDRFFSTEFRNFPSFPSKIRPVVKQTSNDTLSKDQSGDTTVVVKATNKTTRQDPLAQTTVANQVPTGNQTKDNSKEVISAGGIVQERTKVAVQTTNQQQDSLSAPNSPPLESQYALCMQAFRYLVEIEDFEELGHPYAAMEMWGIGLFEPKELSLDHLFEVLQDDAQDSRNVIVECFIEIAAALADLLESFRERPQADRCYIELMVMLGKEPVFTDRALQSSKSAESNAETNISSKISDDDLANENRSNEQVNDDDHELEESDWQIPYENVYHNYGENDEAGEHSEVRQLIDDAVNCLKDLLPAIRFKRQLQLLRYHEISTTSDKHNAGVLSEAKTEPEKPNPSTVDSSIEDIRAIINNLLPLTLMLEDSLRNKFNDTEEAKALSLSQSLSEMCEWLAQTSQRLLRNPTVLLSPSVEIAARELSEDLVSITTNLLSSSSNARSGDLSIVSSATTSIEDTMQDILHLIISYENFKQILEENVSDELFSRPASFTEYIHEPLPTYKESIRVLKLEGSIAHDDPVRCKLITIDFSPSESLKFDYEILSVCSSTAPLTGRIFIEAGGRQFSMAISQDLLAALQDLRYESKERFFWTDHICINRTNLLELNHQVVLMSEIYGRAKRLCAWLGSGNESSTIAFEFVKQALRSDDFHQLLRSEKATKKWVALLELMQRPWFFRRWSVLEISLAKRTTLYCGAQQISWKKFALVNALFMGMETETHRFSEIMKRDPFFQHVPGWFEYVSALGSTIVLQATEKIFRRAEEHSQVIYEENFDDSRSGASNSVISSMGSNTELDFELENSDIRSSNTKGVAHFKALLSLEYLASSLTMLEALTPHDAIFALLPLCRDATPYFDAEVDYQHMRAKAVVTLDNVSRKTPFKVDYQQPLADLCQNFVAFCIAQSQYRSRALNIICRPWAPNPRSEDLKSCDISASLGDLSIRRQKHTGDTESSFAATEDSSLHEHSNLLEHTALLPSWVCSLSNAPYRRHTQSDGSFASLIRQNADSLVGLPHSLSYAAAGTVGFQPSDVTFVKRPRPGSWSMYVKGFILDKISRCQTPSQGGAIPQSWVQAGGWHNIPNSRPPEAFWRTIVADRGPDGGNPPGYYSHVCRQIFSMAKGPLFGGVLDTTELIHTSKSSAIVQFCRRVQAVTWGRRLITTSSRRLGLAPQSAQAGDYMCIIHGCSVPVLVRRFLKTKDTVLEDMRDELMQLCKKILAAFTVNMEKQRKRRRKTHLSQAMSYFQERRLRSNWLNDPEGRSAWLRRYKTAKIYPDASRTKYLWVEMEDEPQKFVIAVNGLESSAELLERRAFEQWKLKKHALSSLEQRRNFELQLRWGRRWIDIVRRKKDLRVRSSLTSVRLRRASLATPRKGIPDKSDEYIRRWEESYLKPYLTEGRLQPPSSRYDPTDRGHEAWFHYEVLGECYVHGMMDGAAIAYQNANGIPTTRLELR